MLKLNNSVLAFGFAAASFALTGCNDNEDQGVATPAAASKQAPAPTPSPAPTPAAVATNVSSVEVSRLELKVLQDPVTLYTPGTIIQDGAVLVNGANLNLGQPFCQLTKHEATAVVPQVGQALTVTEAVRDAKALMNNTFVVEASQDDTVIAQRRTEGFREARYFRLVTTDNSLKIKCQKQDLEVPFTDVELNKILRTVATVKVKAATPAAPPSAPAKVAPAPVPASTPAAAVPAKAAPANAVEAAKPAKEEAKK